MYLFKVYLLKVYLMSPPKEVVYLEKMYFVKVHLTLNSEMKVQGRG